MKSPKEDQLRPGRLLGNTSLEWDGASVHYGLSPQ
jgi:hypothetical protein